LAIFEPVVGDFFEHFRTKGFSTVSLGCDLQTIGTKPVSTKTFAIILLIAISLVSCEPATNVVATKIATPTSRFMVDDWQKYTSEFTSNVGTIHYSLRYPKNWYVYPGSTKSEPGLEGQTYIQNFERIGTVGGDTSDYQVAGKVRLEIYALPCAIVEEGCTPKELSLVAPSLSGVKKVEERDGWTVWTVFLYQTDYRLSLDGYMLGTSEQNDSSLKVLDQILSTVVIK
jgi:hypothetical protein